MLYYSSAFIKYRGLFGDIKHGNEINSPKKETAPMCDRRYTFITHKYIDSSGFPTFFRVAAFSFLSDGLSLARAELLLFIPDLLLTGCGSAMNDSETKVKLNHH